MEKSGWRLKEKAQCVQNLLALEKVDGLDDLSSFSRHSFLATKSVIASSDAGDNPVTSFNMFPEEGSEADPL